MKKLLLLLLLLLCTEPAFAQGTHTVALTWTASIDGGVVSVYRATGACSPSSIFTKVTSGVTGLTYTDTALTPGTYCYQVTTVVNNAESNPSNQVTAVILPAPPTTLGAVPK
jgi:hypothetical protein